MKRMIITISLFALCAAVTLSACQKTAATQATESATVINDSKKVTSPRGFKVLAVESFLADIAQNVAGERVKIDTLIPLGVDPHAFEPTPQDVARIAESRLLISNGAGFEQWLGEVLANAGGERLVIEAATGLTSRNLEGDASAGVEGRQQEGDPHFWLDPNLTIKYVENIRDGLSQVDPEGKDVYALNAEAYIAQLKELDGWIQEQVKQVLPERRLLITNHESLGYFADRYGFKIAGVIIPSVSSIASPSVQQLASLVEQIRASKAPAIFLEAGANPQLAEQIASETGVKVITSLFSHSLTPSDGAAPTYVEMMKYNVRAIVEALK